jgi:hypothetical protein
LPDGFRLTGTVRVADAEPGVSVNGARRADVGGHRHFT